MLLKKLFLSLFLIILFSFSVFSVDEPQLSAYSAVLINAETKEIIYEKNAHTKRSMASTTKIMTSILAMESGRLSEVVTSEGVETEGSSIGLEDGYKLTLDTLVWGMMLESGNDAARLTANFLSGSEENFAVLMNKKAYEIGMVDSNFVTASGLDDEEHYSTAYDMALLGAYSVKNPLFREICSTRVKKVKFIEPDISMSFSNHNRLLSSCEGVFGIKTGFTKKSGRCLVTACERDGIVLIAVTLNAGDDWNDHIKLYNYGYDVCKSKEVFICLPESVCVYSGYNNSVNVCIEENPVKISLKAENCNLTQKVYLKTFVYAPVKKGDVLGRVELIKDDIVIFRSNIISSDDVMAVEPSPEKIDIFWGIFNKIKEIFN